MFGWGVKTVTVDELADKLAQGKQVLIDVREPYEFAAGHVKSAVNVPLGQLADKLGQFDPHAETYVICQSGHRSATAVRLLARAEFECAYSVKGGTSAWRGRLVR
ncbi:MAG TPA: rhodanese-like domain-containing protein [Coriobacteriia bacterium]